MICNVRSLNGHFFLKSQGVKCAKILFKLPLSWLLFLLLVTTPNTKTTLELWD